MRSGRLWAAVALLVLVAACTQHRTIPKERQPCADACGRTQASCETRCAEPKQDVGVLEDVRGSLCDKRCREDYETCMNACL